LWTGLVAQDVESTLNSIGVGANNWAGWRAPETDEYDGVSYQALNYEIFIGSIIQSIKDVDAKVENIDSLLVAQQTVMNLNQLNAQKITTDTLIVSNDANFEGSLTVVGDTTVADIYVNGHIISAGNNPVATNGAVLGASDIATVDGTDTAETVKVIFDTLVTPVAGELAQITFDTAYAQIPRISLAPLNEASLGLPVFIQKTTDGFIITTNVVPVASEIYQYDYIIIQ